MFKGTLKQITMLHYSGIFAISCLLALLASYGQCYNRECGGPDSHVCLYEGKHSYTKFQRVYTSRSEINLTDCRPYRSHKKCPSVKYYRRSWYVPIKQSSAYSVKNCCPGFYPAPNKASEEDACRKAYGCFLALPQNTPKICNVHRQRVLQREKQFYKLNTKFSKYVNTAAAGFTEISQRYSIDPDQAHHFTVFVYLNRRVTIPWRDSMLKRFAGSEEPSKVVYLTLDKAGKATVRKVAKDTGLPYFTQPSWSNPKFPDVTSDKFLNSDEVFAQMRLAGISPKSLRAVYDEHTYDPPKMGLKVKILEKFIGKRRLQKLIKEHLEMSVAEAIEYSYVYVADFPELRNLKANPDYTTPAIPNVFRGEQVKRTRIALTPPIGIFLSVRHGSTRRLKAVAIQRSYKDKQTFTIPGDKQWRYAKALFSFFERWHATIVDHLFDTHIKIEGFALAFFRHLSKKHPLSAATKIHFRGTIALNAASRIAFLNPKSVENHVTPFTAEAWVKAGLRRAETWSYGDGSPTVTLKHRGMYNKHALPFYPFRDDSEKIMNILHGYATELSKTIYASDEEVEKDTELQAMFRELSHETGGKVRGLPGQVKERKEVAQWLSEMLGMIVSHAAVNYPLADYGYNELLAPNLLYVSKKKDFLSHFASPAKAIYRARSVLALSSLRIDSLLDHSEDLPQEDLKCVTRKYRKKLELLSKHLAEEDKRRMKEGYLSYPYLDPKFVPNSIST